MVSGAEWHVTEAGRGVIVSRYPIVGSGTTGGERGSTWALIRVSSADAAQNVLVINPQMPCCEDDDGRQEELDRLVAWLRDASSADGFLEPGTPIVVAGDLNLVGHGQQLTTALEGDIVDVGRFGRGRPLDWDDTPLADAFPYHTTRREAYTWRGDDGPFPPGRLDFILYSDSVLELSKGFVLWTPDLDAAGLEESGLRREDTAIASDHLPVVADFILPRLRSRAARD
jgi:endonuclease/exonuclease/phosphatase family metal-dependent hydrolase